MAVNRSGKLTELLDLLENTYRVPRDRSPDSQWQEIQTIHRRILSSTPEPLVSNWLSISSLPDKVRYIAFAPGYAPEDASFRLGTCSRPAVSFAEGFLSFASRDDLQAHFRSVALIQKAEIPTNWFGRDGWPLLGIDRRTALGHFSNLARQAIEQFFHARGLSGYQMSNQRIAWWAPSNVAPPGQVAFRWSTLSGARKIHGESLKRGFHWHFGVTPEARLGPIPHVRLKSRLVFTADGVKPLGDPVRMHRLRRSFAKGWRNPRWRDMLLAFLHWLADGQSELQIPVGGSSIMRVGLPPMRFMAPVSVPAEVDGSESADEDEATDEELEGDAEDPEDFEEDADS